MDPPTANSPLTRGEHLGAGEAGPSSSPHLLAYPPPLPSSPILPMPWDSSPRGSLPTTSDSQQQLQEDDPFPGFNAWPRGGNKRAATAVTGIANRGGVPSAATMTGPPHGDPFVVASLAGGGGPYARPFPGEWWRGWAPVAAAPPHGRGARGSVVAEPFQGEGPAGGARRGRRAGPESPASTATAAVENEGSEGEEGPPAVFTEQEDEMLKELVKRHGTKRWQIVAAKMQGKAPRDCRKRWQSYLNTCMNKSSWSLDEDRMLLEGHAQYGNRWTEIAKVVPGRTDNAVKNRYAVLCRKRSRMLSDGRTQFAPMRSTTGPKAAPPSLDTLSETGTAAMQTMHAARFQQQPGVGPMVMRPTCIHPMWAPPAHAMAASIELPHVSGQGSGRMVEERPAMGGIQRCVGARPGLCIQIPDGDPPPQALPARGTGAHLQAGVSRPVAWNGALTPERLSYLQERRLPGLESVSPRLDVPIDLEEVMGWLTAQTPTSTVGSRQPNSSITLCASTTNTPRSNFAGSSAAMEPSPRSAWARGVGVPANPMSHHMLLMPIPPPNLPSPNLLRAMLSPRLLPGPEPQIASPLDRTGVCLGTEWTFVKDGTSSSADNATHTPELFASVGGASFCTRGIEDLVQILTGDSSRKDVNEASWTDGRHEQYPPQGDHPTPPIPVSDTVLKREEADGVDQMER